ncbi:response regulator transcription factor [Propionimicrobium sp. PCR01-08-3]|uniref:response regulator transcription factor n=1 Tax=Propionimicrobium sp. PCR01-08-3 TaxID=3052086 RepID=UPI00255CB56D|nr:response regulator transcription factor [Propionimicrobium sp. PCR01-08-3]WIY82244.1 response regulator transcription factor [Propionimicrobium sp. PCR01-08-3]
MTARENDPAARTRILIADDDRLVRTGIAAILTSASDMEVTAQAADGHEAVREAARHRLDVALLDIQMPRFDGIQALREIRRQQPKLPIAMLTTFSDDHLISDALGAGALGFLLKSDDPQQLITSVRALAQGGGAFSPRVARWLASREHDSQRAEGARKHLTDALTPRQIELLTHIGHGLSNSQIAQAMYLSEGTVKQYVSQLFDVLGVDNRVHAAVAAYRSGLL